VSVTKNKSRSRSVISTILSLVVLVLAIILFLNKQYVADQIAVWAYQPTQAVEAVSNRVGFSNKGTFYFYVTHPKIATAEQFNQDCPRQEPSSPILGCYVNGRIFLYDITNEQLDGIEEVTAAHEMLHAAWDRLGDAEKQRISALLQDEYVKLSDGPLAERMAYYQRNEPGQLVNELHSILPTEVEALTPELESYYKHYFKDRKSVVALHNQYDSVLEKLRVTVAQLDGTLTSLAASIEAETIEYNSESVQLESAISTFNRRASTNTFDSQEAFASERANLVEQSNQLQAKRDAINADIDRYNQTYEQYQVVGSQLETLNKSLDSISNLPQNTTIVE
jgi:uncharacterized protein YlxW (UPF0749 family)